jgi:hypothetical protein
MRGVAGEALPFFEGIVKLGGRILSHQLIMAVGAQGRIRSLQKATFIRAVAGMTGHAIAAPNWRVHMGLGELGLEIVMTRIADRVRPTEQDAGNVRPVWIVAFGAFLFLEGIMQLGQLFHLLLRVFVARKAQLATGRIQELLAACSVGGLAGQATVVTLDGVMSEGHIRAGILMATKTQLVARVDQ